MNKKLHNRGQDTNYGDSENIDLKKDTKNVKKNKTSSIVFILIMLLRKAFIFPDSNK